ncbi:MAG: ABC transporter substrate-binding protein [Chloroflexota bacterium]|nr:ABC transporter substrate-binding protein [Chloroflexota bacterium]
MDEHFRVSRRHLVTSGTVALAGLCPFTPPVQACAIRQSGPVRWQIADGLRLAGSVSGPSSLDPARARDLSTNFLLRQVFRGLMSLDTNLEPVPELAEAVDVSDDGRVHEFVLRDMARFHDGRPVGPADVQFSLSRALDPRTTDGSLQALAGITYLRDIDGADDQLAGRSELLSGVAITGDRSLSITLGQPSPTFMMRLASVPASIVDSEQIGMDDDWSAAPNGSGPFAVASWAPSDSLNLVAADTWWPGRPAVPRVKVRLGSSASQPVNLFQGGEIDLLDDIPPELIDLIEDPATGVPYGELQAVELFATSYIAFGNTVAPLDDIHVRRALQYVFPNELVAKASFNGAVLAANGLLPPGLLNADWPTTAIAGDAEAARDQLRQSRYGEAEHVPPIAIYAADVAVVEALRDVTAQELGLEVEAIEVGWPDFLTGLAERRFPAYSLYWGADYPDPESLIDMLFGERSAENYTGYANPDLELLLTEARSTSGDERVAAYVKANQLLVDDAALIPLYHPVGYTLTRPGIGGVTATPMGILGLETIHEQ